jgi:hypothetical protein
MRFEFLMVVNIMVLWPFGMMSCSLVDKKQNFEGTCCLHLQGRTLSHAGTNNTDIVEGGTRNWFTHSSNPVPSFPRSDHSSLYGLLFYPEDGVSRFLQNLGIYLPDYVSSHPTEDCNLNCSRVFNVGHWVTKESVKKISYLLFSLEVSLNRLMPDPSLKKTQWLIIHCINNLMVNVC